MFRFTIRDLLWLTVVVGLAVGWWAERGNLIKNYEAEAAEQSARAQNHAIILRDHVEKYWNENVALKAQVNQSQQLDENP